MSSLREELSNLSVDRKYELLDILWESIETDAPALTAEQSAELDDRVTRYLRNPSNIIAWEEIRSELQKRQ